MISHFRLMIVTKFANILINRYHFIAAFHIDEPNKIWSIFGIAEDKKE